MSTPSLSARSPEHGGKEADDSPSRSRRTKGRRAAHDETGGGGGGGSRAQRDAAAITGGGATPFLSYVLKALRENLSAGVALNCVAAGTSEATEAALRSGWLRPEESFLLGLGEASALDTRTRATVAAQAKGIVKRFGERQRIAKQLRVNRVAAIQAQKRYFAHQVDALVTNVRMRNQQHARNLRRQQTVASRRVQELLFECFGEVYKVRAGGLEPR